MSLDLRGLCPLLQVFDMPASLAFYRDVLGFQIVQAAPPRPEGHTDNFGWVWLRRGDAELMLNTAYDPDAARPTIPDPDRMAAHEDTALFMGCADLDGAARHLGDLGVRFTAPTVTGYGMRQLYLKDPDGFNLCLQWPTDPPRPTAN
jgi:glyoxylase I family protein